MYPERQREMTRHDTGKERATKTGNKSSAKQIFKVREKPQAAGIYEWGTRNNWPASVTRNKSQMLELGRHIKNKILFCFRSFIKSKLFAYLFIFAFCFVLVFSPL